MQRPIAALFFFKVACARLEKVIERNQAEELARIAFDDGHAR